nr:auxin-responsive protein SAUR72-like [Ipomoea batatas]GMD30326.1 auxin-responsive protein SAUR72-like [Ipomoea batatas]GME10677.1 auxin-responsive protein SAUR72-like [Ipomoea batatas]GME16652.1 auxin-responsive protein SAUR72-like [Ipomoea batatas]
MAKGGKLTKIKSAVLKKMQSFKLSRGPGGGGSSVVVATTNSFSDDDEHFSGGPYSAAASSKDLHPVYVGKSRRRYLVGSDIIDHPLFRELAERSGSYSDESIAVGCEVVLFEHLLWMLENADPQPESLDELVDFYAC